MTEHQPSLCELQQHWHLDLALAYARGMLPQVGDAPPGAALRLAREHGLDLDPFKRSRTLQRVTIGQVPGHFVVLADARGHDG
jgi:hypothetical protein